MISYYESLLGYIMCVINDENEYCPLCDDTAAKKFGLTLETYRELIAQCKGVVGSYPTSYFKKEEHIEDFIMVLKLMGKV